MSDPVTAELFVPTASLTREPVNRLLDQLVALRLLAPNFRSLRRSYSRLGRPDSESSVGLLSEALDVLSIEGNCLVWIELRRSAMQAGADDFVPELSFALTDDDVANGLGSVEIRMSAVRSSRNRSHYGEFLALTRLVAELLDATYGWVATEIKIERRPVAVASVAALELQPLEWANFYGRGYVERIGYEQLRSMPPVASVEALANGGAMVTFGPSYLDVKREHLKTTSEHLGVPFIPKEWEKVWEEVREELRHTNQQ